MNDDLTQHLDTWRGSVLAPQERLELRWSDVLEAPVSNGVDRDDRRRPIACTAFPGTSLATAASQLLLWRLGYGPAALDMRLLPHDLAHRLRLLRPRRIFLSPDQRPAVEAALRLAGIDRIDVCELDRDPRTWPQLLPARAAVESDPGLIVFTSGTTGAAKAVLLSRANILACAREVAAAQRLTPNDRALNALSLAHVNAPVISLLATVISGGDVVLMRQFDPRQFWSLVQLHAVTWANLVPPLIAMLARHPGTSPPQTESLRFVRSASAPLPVATMQEFESLFGVAVVESYGISEASSQVTINDVPPARRVPGSVGRPRGVRVRVVDDAGREQPPGQEGEVVVAGPTVMKGYLDDEAATGEAIVDGWLHTGDIGVLDQEGNLQLVGRIKELINRGGEKIAPRAVEEALLQHPAVADAAVVGVPDTVYGEEVKAFVVLRAGVSVTARELLHFAAERLPIHARPRFLEFIDGIPRNPSGKVARRQLLSA